MAATVDDQADAKHAHLETSNLNNDALPEIVPALKRLRPVCSEDEQPSTLLASHWLVGGYVAKNVATAGVLAARQAEGQPCDLPATAAEIDAHRHTDWSALEWGEAQTDMIVPRALHAGALVGDTVFVAGGWTPDHNLASVEYCRGQGGVWQLLGDMPSPRAGPAGCTMQGLFTVLGGYSHNQVLQLHHANNTWLLLPNLPAERYRLAACSSGSQTLYAVGGWGQGCTWPDLLRLDARTARWDQLPPMQVGRHNTACVIDASERIYVVGGTSNEGSLLDLSERFDVRAMRWETLPSLVCARQSATACVLGGQVQVLGGAGKNGVLRGLEVWREAEQRWVLAPGTLPEGRSAAVCVPWEL